MFFPEFPCDFDDLDIRDLAGSPHSHLVLGDADLLAGPLKRSETDLKKRWTQKRSRYKGGTTMC